MTFCSAWAQGRPSPAWTNERRGWCISCGSAAQSPLGVACPNSICLRARSCRLCQPLHASLSMARDMIIASSRLPAGAEGESSAFRAALRQPTYRAHVSPDSAITTSPIPSSRPVWDHPPVVRRCNPHRRLQAVTPRHPGLTAFVFPGQIWRSSQQGHLMIRKVGRHV